MTSAQQLARAQAFISFLSSLDCDGVAPLLLPDFTHRIFPLSLEGNGKEVRDKAEFMDLMRSVSSMIPRLNYQEPMDTVQAQDVVVFHLQANGETRNGKPYKNEYLFTIRFRGELIYEVREFMDSKYVTAALAEFST
ncbi:hypothetical protein C8J57DRAFT_444445 [Mycena rebaudengoi]|nr:hypothetical protein C8J57DRAFT_444445 [Mycena rebaudengoi]